MKPKLNLVRTVSYSVFATMLMIATLAFGQVETIDATARGTSTADGQEPSTSSW